MLPETFSNIDSLDELHQCVHDDGHAANLPALMQVSQRDGPCMSLDAKERTCTPDLYDQEVHHVALR